MGPRVRISFAPARSLLRTRLSGANPIDNRRGLERVEWHDLDETSRGVRGDPERGGDPPLSLPTLWCCRAAPGRHYPAWSQLRPAGGGYAAGLQSGSTANCRAALPPVADFIGRWRASSSNKASLMKSCSHPAPNESGPSSSATTTVTASDAAVTTQRNMWKHRTELGYAAL